VRVLGRLLLACVALGVMAMAGLGLLAAADYVGETGGIPTTAGRVEWTLHHGDHLHFAVHMVAGRVFDLCPCTRRAAAEQYWRASFHAQTPTEMALARNIRPRSFSGYVAYTMAPFAVGAEWIGKGVAWIGGDRPLHAAYVSIDAGEFSPDEIHVAPGATVTWRNQDLDVHVVVAKNGQFRSGPLEPTDDFSHTFTQRGRYEYYDASYGPFGETDVTGVVIVG
jgi:hypothetical protein